ncbi:MAG: Heptosyltransferase-1, partial [uncultured Thiotrichaceae bacterium]
MQKILIIRMSAVGDIVMATPIIDAIKASYPAASISWLVQPHFSAPIKDHPAIDHVIEWDHRLWSKLWKERKFGELFKSIRAFRKQLRSYGFDTVLDMQGLLKSGIPAWFTGAEQRIGLGSKEGSQIFMHQVVARDEGNVQKIGSEYRYLAEQLRLDTSGWAMRLESSAEAKAEVESILQQHTDSKEYVVICPFTTRPQKHWFDDYWRELVGLLHENTSKSVLMLGGPGDK